MNGVSGDTVRFAQGKCATCDKMRGIEGRVRKSLNEENTMETLQARVARKVEEEGKKR